MDKQPQPSHELIRAEILLLPLPAMIRVKQRYLRRSPFSMDSVVPPLILLPWMTVQPMERKRSLSLHLLPAISAVVTRWRSPMTRPLLSLSWIITNLVLHIRAFATRTMARYRPPMVAITTTCRAVVVQPTGRLITWKMVNIRSLPPGPINTTTSTTRSMPLTRSPMRVAPYWHQPLSINRMPQANSLTTDTAGTRLARST